MTTTILVGLAVALLYVEVTGLVPGGLIVPAYLALYLDQPGRLGATLAAAFLAFGISRLASRRFLLYGRRRFVLVILLGAFFSQLWIFFWPRLLAAPLDLRVIGWVVPGLLANNLSRQKFWATLASAGTATLLTYALVECLKWVGIR
ncbi:MAG: poly-gamma-glutamate biosynthesis protein PgsC [Candidatus Aminicenantes bacterium]|nr:poly-gamma-glutamate biosynthesis protein PgsC [Candidatus Aminicenantes bacterium]